MSDDFRDNFPHFSTKTCCWSSLELFGHVFLRRTEENYPLIIIKYPPCLFFCFSLILCDIFQKEVFRVSQCYETPSYKYFLPLLCICLVLKCAAKSLKIGSEIKILCPKMSLNRDFAWASEIIPKIFNFGFWQICQFYSNIWTPGMLFLLFGVGCLHF